MTEKCKHNECECEKCDVDPKDKTIEELTKLIQHLQADFENYKKRVEREKEETAYYFKKEIITKLLPVLDMFELAIKHKENKDDFIKGMEMIYAQFISTLENEGLESIKTCKNFDPRLHEAIITEESNEDDKILEELQKGYMLSGKVIRYSRVKVSKKENKCE